MNWLEQVFKASPDGGSGATEVVLMVVALVFMLVALMGSVSQKSLNR